MPPKKKKGGKKKKKKDDGELTIEDKYKKTLEEIEALKDHLSMRKELARRSQTVSTEWKNKMLDAEKVLEEHREDQRAVSADMTRQYKTMQTDMGLRIHQLEAELQRTRTNLERTEAELKKTEQEKERLCAEKDEEISLLNLSITSLTRQFKDVLENAMTSMEDQIIEAEKSWTDKSTLIQARNKQTLLEFGLNPLDL